MNSQVLLVFEIPVSLSWAWPYRFIVRKSEITNFLWIFGLLTMLSLIGRDSAEPVPTVVLLAPNSKSGKRWLQLANLFTIGQVECRTGSNCFSIGAKFKVRNHLAIVFTIFCCAACTLLWCLLEMKLLLMIAIVVVGVSYSYCCCSAEHLCGGSYSEPTGYITSPSYPVVVVQ